MGEGVPVIICHGAGSCHLSFFQQITGMASDRIRVVTWDQRGYGNSTLETGRFGIGIGVEDLTSVLRAVRLDDAPVHIVSQAMGALVAVHWAIASPRLIQSLALWDGPFAASDDGLYLTWKLDPGDKGVQSTTINRQVGKTRSARTSPNAIGRGHSSTNRCKRSAMCDPATPSPLRRPRPNRSPLARSPHSMRPSWWGAASLTMSQTPRNIKG